MRPTNSRQELRDGQLRAPVTVGLHHGLILKAGTRAAAQRRARIGRLASSSDRGRRRFCFESCRSNSQPSASVRHRHMATEDRPHLDLFSEVRDELMTAEQLAVLLQLRRSTIEDYARRGLLPSLKLGRHRRFIRSDVLDALDQLRRQTR